MEALFSVEEGKQLIAAARKSIKYFSASGSLLREKTDNTKLMEKRGCFVTINGYPGKELRGCVGFPYPVKPLWDAVIDAAVQAAFNDPRFPALKADELAKIVLEISILTLPKEITGDRKKLPGQIKVGEDGLIVKKGTRSGLLLPQVAVEYDWDSETFLNHCCNKAGLPEVAWKQDDTHVLRFQVQIFKEESPSESVVEETR